MAFLVLFQGPDLGMSGIEVQSRDLLLPTMHAAKRLVREYLLHHSIYFARESVDSSWKNKTRNTS